jgi:hypothetical protein
MWYTGGSPHDLLWDSPFWVMVIQIILLIESSSEMIQMH